MKNNHLGFAILYNYQGVIRRYFPDFIIKLKNGDHLILETKGQDSEQNKTKRAFLDEWCRAINQHGGFSKWLWTVSFDPNDLEKLLHDAIIRSRHHPAHVERPDRSPYHEKRLKSL